MFAQGRAVGVHVAAAIQDPRKEVLPAAGCSRPGSRCAWPSRPRSTWSWATACATGARCAIGSRVSQPGVGLRGARRATRRRCGSGSPSRRDDEIRDMARTYGRLRVIDGDTIDPQEGAA